MRNDHAAGCDYRHFAFCGGLLAGCVEIFSIFAWSRISQQKMFDKCFNFKIFSITPKTS